MNKKIILIFIVFFISHRGISQVISDAKLWAGASVSKKINDFEFSFTEELRLNENFSYIDKSFSEISTDYKIAQYLVLSASYRFSQENDYELGGFLSSHRFNLDATYKYKKNPFKFSFRTRIQNIAKYSKNTDYNINKTYSRNKISIEYKINKKFEPFLSYEFFYQFNIENIINRNRTSSGIAYSINNKNSIKAYYIFENRFNVIHLEHNHIWGISYNFEI